MLRQRNPPRHAIMWFQPSRCAALSLVQVCTCAVSRACSLPANSRGSVLVAPHTPFPPPMQDTYRYAISWRESTGCCPGLPPQRTMPQSPIPAAMMFRAFSSGLRLRCWQGPQPPLLLHLNSRRLCRYSRLPKAPSLGCAAAHVLHHPQNTTPPCPPPQHTQTHHFKWRKGTPRCHHNCPG